MNNLETKNKEGYNNNLKEIIEYILIAVDNNARVEVVDYDVPFIGEPTPVYGVDSHSILSLKDELYKHFKI